MELKTFFSFLSERFYKENDLSDMTYAFMQADETFQDLFLEYCFDKKGIKPLDLWREYTSDDSRPDFYFTDQTNTEYLIEVKINDRNQHFKQYEREFSTVKKAFIANYEYDGKDSKNWDRKITWGGFVKFLESHEKDVTQKELLEGYLKYLKIITDIKEFKKMNINKTEDLIKFHDSIELIAQNNGCEKYGGSTSKGREFYGQYFNFKKKRLKFWFGIFYGDSNGNSNGNNNDVFLSFKNDLSWTPKACKEKIEKIKTSGKHYKKPYLSEGWYYFGLNKAGMDILSDGNATKEEQEKVLDNFLKEVLTVVDA